MKASEIIKELLEMEVKEGQKEEDLEKEDGGELDPEAKKIIDYNKKHFSSLF